LYIKALQRLHALPVATMLDITLRRQSLLSRLIRHRVSERRSMMTISENSKYLTLESRNYECVS
jgi:hypothetical protein